MFNNVIMFVFLALPVLAIIIFFYFYWTYNFSRNPSIPAVFRPCFPLGNTPNPFTLERHLSEFFADYYLICKRCESKISKYFAINQLFYLVCDPKYVKYTLQDGFESFTDKGFNYNEKYDPLSTNLFFVKCPKWNFIRSKLSPTYTSMKLKTMFETVLECGHQMQQYMQDLHHQEIDSLDISKSYSINVIASSAFGVKSDCFKNPDSEFKKRSNQIFAFPIWRLVNTILLFVVAPNLAVKMRLVLFEKSLTDFFIGVTRDVMEYRSKNGIRRNDMLQLMIDSQTNLNDERKLTLEDITAQAFVFFAAGYETSSATLTFCLYELAVNVEIQDKLREEVFEVLKRHDQNITYDTTMEMKYMNQVLEETLRKYPALPYIFRKCTKDYKYPNIDCALESCDRIIIPVMGLHHDPEYFPEPKRFDPDRFSIHNRSKIPSGAYIPFGEGPRICIGQRFAMMQLKVALTVLLSKFSFGLSEKTVTPVRFEPYSFALNPRDKIILTVNKI